MSGTILRRRDRTARPPRVEHYSSAVNTEGVLALLRACGCDLAQGCCFSPPLAVDGIEKLVRGDDGADDQPKFGT